MPRSPRPYDEAFKRAAVDAFVASGQPRRLMAKEIGVNEATLRKWYHEFHGWRDLRFGGDPTSKDERSSMSPVALAQEIWRMARTIHRHGFEA